MEPAGDELTPAPVSSWQHRAERHPAGRAIISVFIVVVLVSITAWNLPRSGLRDSLVPVVRPFVETVGLDQNWSVFAPNPRRLTLDLTARVEFADGRSTVWRVPLHREPFLTPYRTYRWQKWMEHVRADDSSGLWGPVARWIAAEHADEGEVARVTLVRHWYDTPEPGSGQVRPEWNQYEFHVLDLGSSG